MKCTKPHCLNEATEQMLGRNPICRIHADERNRKSRERSAIARSKGHYSPSIQARWSEDKKERMKQL